MLPRPSNGILPMVLRENLNPRFEKIKKQPHDKSHTDYPIHLYLKENDITIRKKGSEIVEFLSKKNVLITGATGFLGKLFVEKILRSSEDVIVYVLIREKKGKTIETRLEETLNSYVFDRLAKIRPDYKTRIIAINGDVAVPGLGLSNENRKTLTEKLNIIYHAAATVRFDEALRIAVQTNVLGTKEIIQLAKECQHLESLAYVSTAYSNCDRDEIGENFYQPNMTADELIKILDMFDDDVLKRITPGLLGPMPNTYSLTKQSTEDLIKKEAKGLPCCICRPSIVMNAFREPIRGWGDALFGPMGLILAGALGIVHVQKCNPKKKADLVPADYCINHCIVASYKTAKDKNLEEVPIYNFVSSNDNPVYWEAMTHSKAYETKIGSTKPVFPPIIFLTPNGHLAKFLKFLTHWLPAYILDFYATCVGKKPILRKIYTKFDKFGGVLEFFCCNEWRFYNANTRALWNTLNDVDKKNFNFDITTVDWNEFFILLLVAVRELVFHEYLDNLDKGRSHSLKLHYIERAIQLAFLLLGGYLLYKITFMFVSSL